jgi:hypothetical protein
VVDAGSAVDTALVEEGACTEAAGSVVDAALAEAADTAADGIDAALCI